MRNMLRIALVGLAALSVAACDVAGNVVSAPGRVANRTLETGNIIFNYEYFFDTNAAFQGRVAQVNQYREFFQTETDPAEKNRLRTEFAAVQQSCRELANKYNANATKINRGIFKDPRGVLPTSLDAALCEQ
jgi:hypothetical protein